MKNIKNILTIELTNQKGEVKKMEKGLLERVAKSVSMEVEEVAKGIEEYDIRVFDSVEEAFLWLNFDENESVSSVLSNLQEELSKKITADMVGKTIMEAFIEADERAFVDVITGKVVFFL